MFSETRYAMNGDLRVAYRASPEGARDIVFVPNWFTYCEIFPELPSLQGWVEAMTSLGRLIFFDQPGTGASDPVTPGALPTLEQWADSITAVLDDLGSQRSGPPRESTARSRQRRCSRQHIRPAPPRWSCSRATRIRLLNAPRADSEEFLAAFVAMWGTGEFEHLINPDMPWNEEIRAAWARHERLAASPGTVALMMPLADANWTCGRCFRQSACPPSSSSTPTTR